MPISYRRRWFARMADSRLAHSLLALALFALALLAIATNLLATCPAVAEPPAALKDFRPDRLVRFATRAEAEQRRERLVRFIWPDGLPTRAATVSVDSPRTAEQRLALLAGPLRGLDATNTGQLYAFPMYARHFSAGSIGDAEQTFAPLYGEEDSDDAETIADTATGAASWLEIFALGGLGDGRQQIQILNHRDTCCFHGDVYETYSGFLERLVERLKPGRWQVHSDRTHQTHSISPAALEKVILRVLTQSSP